jgi:hypothetical protein
MNLCFPFPLFHPLSHPLFPLLLLFRLTNLQIMRMLRLCFLTMVQVLVEVFGWTSLMIKLL